MTHDTIGVDISKDHLDAHSLLNNAAKRFPNTAQGCRSLLAWIGDRPVERVVYEPTGPYHRTFEQSFAEAGLPLAKINPRRARRFAEALGQEAKTDRLDAILLARLGKLLEPGCQQPPSPTMRALQDLQQARAALVKDRTATTNRRHAARLPLIKRQLDQRLRQIDRQLKMIETEIQRLIGQDQELKERLKIIKSIPGIGAVTAWSLLIDLPELGQIDPKAAAKLVGVAPISRQSGNWKGRSMIRGGRADVRQALYMPALIAARYNPDLKVLYQRLIGAGKPVKVALVAVMRKLVLLANTLLKAQRCWLPEAP